MTEENDTVVRLIMAMGRDVAYDIANNSFSPHYSDTGLCFTDDGGVDTLYFHYNRGATPFGKPFLQFDAGAKPESISQSALGVRQTYAEGSGRVAFYERNSFLAACTDGVAVTFDFSDDRITEARVEERQAADGGRVWLFEGYLPRVDERDPDETFPFIIGIRLMAGDPSGDGIDEPLRIAPDAAGNTVLAITANALEIERDEIIERLDRAPTDIDEAHVRTREWYAQTLGSLDLSAEDEREEKVLAKAAAALTSNLCKAPGELGGRVALFPARGSYAGIWPWDSCFHNLGLEYMEPRLAEDSLLLLTDTMRADGKIPGFMTSTWPRPSYSQPALVGWAAERLWKQRGNREFVRTILPKLWKNSRWWLTQRMTRYGLISCPHGLESGWDNSTRWDEGPILATDMNSHLLTQIRVCEQFAMVVGDMPLAQKAHSEIETLSRTMIDLLYDPEDNLFRDVLVETGEKVKLLTPAAFLPAWAGVGLPEERVRRMIENVLLDPERLFGDVPFPSVAYDEPKYEPKHHWRGPMWMPISWLMLELLERYGYDEARAEAVERLYRICLEDGNLRERFDSDTGAGSGAWQQGWTAAIFLRLKMERQGILPGGK